MEPKEKEHITLSDKNGRYCLKRLIARGGVKEGIWVQPYHIIAEADGYAPQLSRICQHPDTCQSLITGVDFVLEKAPHR